MPRNVVRANALHCLESREAKHAEEVGFQLVSVHPMMVHVLLLHVQASTVHMGFRIRLLADSPAPNARWALHMEQHCFAMIGTLNRSLLSISVLFEFPLLRFVGCPVQEEVQSSLLDLGRKMFN